MSKKETEKEAMFRTIVTEYSGMIAKVCYMYATDASHRQDLSQDTMVNIWRGLDTFRGDSQLSTWVYRTCINTCISSLRKEKFHRNTVTTDIIPDIEGDNDDKTARLKEMYRLISTLNPMDKALIMMWLDELPYEEIAKVSGMSRNNVATRLRRIKQHLVEMSNE